MQKFMMLFTLLFVAFFMSACGAVEEETSPEIVVTTQSTTMEEDTLSQPQVTKEVEITELNTTKDNNQTTNIEEIEDGYTIKVGTSFQKVYQATEDTIFSLLEAPIGMSILQSGIVTWTPTTEQVGSYDIEVISVKSGQRVEETLHLDVVDNGIVYDGVFLDLSGRKIENADGTSAHPYSTFKDACKNLSGKSNIFVRGGRYYNKDFGMGLDSPSRYPAITGCQGTAQNPLVLRPWGNESVTLVTDALYGLKVRADVKYFVIEGFEIEGVSDTLRQSDIVAQWWDAKDTIKGSGISINGSYITIRNNVVHHFPGSGISAINAIYITIEDNIVYDCDWWTIAGSHGIGITKAQEDDTQSSEGKFYNKIINNLIFGVEQRMMSRVWSKGFATLTIDEGEAFLIQEGYVQDDSSESGYAGNYLIENNIIAYNGKTGVVNLAKNTTIKNNSYYLNGTTTRQAGFRINKSDAISLVNNIVEAASNKVAYSVGGDYSPSLSANYLYGAKDTSLPDGFNRIDAHPFINPKDFDFRVSDTALKTMGVSQNVLEHLQKMIQHYKIAFKPTNYVVDQVALTKAIVEARPEGSSVDYSHYDDEKPYLIIKDLPEGHPAGDEMILYTPHPYSVDE